MEKEPLDQVEEFEASVEVTIDRRKCHIKVRAATIDELLKKIETVVAAVEKRQGRGSRVAGII